MRVKQLAVEWVGGGCLMVIVDRDLRFYLFVVVMALDGIHRLTRDLHVDTLVRFLSRWW